MNQTIEIILVGAAALGIAIVIGQQIEKQRVDSQLPLFASTGIPIFDMLKRRGYDVGVDTFSSASY